MRQEKTNPIVFREDTPPENLSKFEHRTGIFFYDKRLLKQAFTHRSYANENKGAENNERLEFLGDAVVELIVTNHLYKKFPNEQEGALTSYRSKLVSTETFGEIAQDLKMNEYLFMSRGQKKDHLSFRHILADTYEAFVGAIFLDQGYNAAETFISSTLFPRIHGLVERSLWRDWKSVLQGKAQAEFKITPEYVVVNESGPDNEKVFTIEVRIGDRLKMQGTGRSKAEAGKDAAHKLLALKGWL